MPLGIRIKIGNEEKDLDDIFLKISDYNTNSSNYQAGEAVVLTQETGIKYIENGVKKDLIDRYIGYDSDGYIAANYETDTNRIGDSSLNAITDICGNNLVNLFYQLGTKKKNISSDYKSYSIHNKNKRVDFEMTFIQSVVINVNANLALNTIVMSYNGNNIISISGNTISTNSSQTVVQLKNIAIVIHSHTQLKFMIEGSLKLNLGTSGTATYLFNKDTV